MLLSIDGTFIVQLINFVVFFALVNVVFIKPVRAAIMQRREYIDSVAADYERFTSETGTLRAKEREMLAAARRDVDAEIARSRGEGQARAAEITGSYNERVSDAVERAREEVASEMQLARANEERLIDEIAETLTARALGART